MENLKLVVGFIWVFLTTGFISLAILSGEWRWLVPAVVVYLVGRHA